MFSALEITIYLPIHTGNSPIQSPLRQSMSTVFVLLSVLHFAIIVTSSSTQEPDKTDCSLFRSLISKMDCPSGTLQEEAFAVSGLVR